MKRSVQTGLNLPFGSKETALITGASSGIGRSYARKLAEKGYNLIITGRRKEKLESLREELVQQYSIQVEVILAELSDEQDLNNLISSVHRRDDISVLVNNAGFGSGLTFCRCDITDHLRMLNVHVVATLKLIHSLLPKMMLYRRGYIINVSSVGAFAPAPGNTVYAATKIFLKSFTESLSMETANWGIRVQCVCPGFTKTEFHDHRAAGKAKSQKKGWMEPEKVVEKSLRALEKGLVICIPGRLNKFLVWVLQILPRRIYYLLMGMLGAAKDQGMNPGMAR